MFLHIITFILLIAKVLGYVEISWLLVFLPSIIVVVFSLLVIIVAAVIALK